MRADYFGPIIKRDLWSDIYAILALIGRLKMYSMTLYVTLQVLVGSDSRPTRFWPCLTTSTFLIKCMLVQTETPM